tara:strand:+ start:5278 stop:5793 length:516 start_codon:yes stop_codon:yes gene_type:complete
MKIVNKFFSIFILLIISSNALFANEPIAYIDIDFIIKNSNIGKKTLNTINNKNNENINNLKSKEKILKDLEIQISNKKNIISEEAFINEVKLFREKVDEFKIEQKEIVKNFNEYKKKQIDNVFKKISPIINAYMEKKSLKILFDSKNIFMARNDLNVTNELLNEINNLIEQ